MSAQALVAALLLFPAAAMAQSAPASVGSIASNASDANAASSDIVVTGTRVERSGYQAPTPVTVATQAQIEAAARPNIADFVNTLPSVAGSASPQNTQSGVGNGQAGINAINLRGLGPNRTLILLDGQRSVVSSGAGLVDINDFPQALISRVEVVTGGASAAYGSDALSGVVNFILDKKFTGIKADGSIGISNYGDDNTRNFSFTAGTPFASGRGHILMSLESSDDAGTDGDGGRAWDRKGYLIIQNPAYAAGNGQPERLLITQGATSGATLGGIITNTALRGTAFGPGGTPYQYNYGSLVSGSSSQGGQWASSLVNNAITLDPEQHRKGAFGRISYDVTPDIELYAQYSYNWSKLRSYCCQVFDVANISVQASNAFLPASVAQRAAALEITQFTLGSFNGDLPVLGTENSRRLQRMLAGATGSFMLAGNRWKWDISGQHDIANVYESSPDNLNKSRFALAIDDVINPATGQIVCRSTLTNPTNGCVPYNLFGTGVNNSSVVNYLTATSWRRQTFKQDFFSGSLSGEPFSIWAGPVSVALGMEHRRESIGGSVDPIGGANGYFLGNYLASFGAYQVTEGFFETVVPVLKDLPFAHKLDLNGAVRETGYSTSGMVTTWKIGGTYEPIPGVRFRMTRSRDIRAPDLLELYNAGALAQNTITDPSNHNALTSYQSLTTGNPNLKPEVADTLGVGMVLEPHFLPGFSASVDYYHIKINGAISTLTAQSIVDQCFAGNQLFCSAITRGTINGVNTITAIRIQPMNFVGQIASGIDFQVDYRFTGLGGRFALNGTATHYIKNYNNDGVNPPTNEVGVNSLPGINTATTGVPHWIYRGSVTYTHENTTFSLTGRGVSAGKYDSSFIQCTINCPTSTIGNRTINNNHIAGAFYVDAYLAERVATVGRGAIELYVNVQNLFNKDPAEVALGPSGSPFIYSTTNPAYYDVLGRVFRVGARYRY